MPSEKVRRTWSKREPGKTRPGELPLDLRQSDTRVGEQSLGPNWFGGEGRKGVLGECVWGGGGLLALLLMRKAATLTRREDRVGSRDPGLGQEWAAGNRLAGLSWEGRHLPGAGLSPHRSS